MNMLEPKLNFRKAYRTQEEKKEYILLNRKKQNQKKSNCPKCNKEMLKNSINQHIRNIH